MSRRTRIAPASPSRASRPQAPRAPRRPRSTIATSAEGAPSALPSVLEHVRAAELELLGVLEAGTLIPLVMRDGTLHGRASDLAPDARCIVVAMTDDPEVLAGRITRALRVAALGAWEDSGEVSR